MGPDRIGDKQEEKLRKEAAKEEAKERRRLEHEKKRWENGKFALQNTRALIDTKVIEKGLIGGYLLSTFKTHLDSFLG